MKLVAGLNSFGRAEGFQEVFVQAGKVDDYAIDFYRKTASRPKNRLFISIIPFGKSSDWSIICHIGPRGKRWRWHNYRSKAPYIGVCLVSSRSGFGSREASRELSRNECHGQLIWASYATL